MRIRRFLYNASNRSPTEFTYCLIFGLLSILFSCVHLKVKNYENILTDFREIPLLISIFYLKNPLSIIFLCLLAITSVIPDQSLTFWPMFISHSISLSVIWLIYQWLLKTQFKNWVLGLIWGAVILLYYLFIIIPLLIIAYRIFGIDSGYSFSGDYLNVTTSAKFEIISTALVTGIYLVQYKVRELQKLHQIQLKKLNENLIKTNKDLENFIYTASHELMVPISNIEGSLKLLISNNLSKEEEAEMFTIMLRSVSKFKETVENLTEIYKVQQLHEEDIELNILQDVIGDTIKSLKDEIQYTDCEIITDFSRCPNIKFSVRSFTRILKNIISNAIRFRSSDRPLKIFIKSEETEKYNILTISDNGIGIKKSYQHKIFSMFKKAHQSSGRGMGLYIVKRLLENEEGYIEVESEVGTGSDFKMFFRK